MIQTYVNFTKPIFSGILEIDGRQVHTDDVKELLIAERSTEWFLAPEYNKSEVNSLSYFEPSWYFDYEISRYQWLTFENDISPDPRQVHLFQTNEQEPLLLLVETHPDYDNLTLEQVEKMITEHRPIFYREVQMPV